MAQLLKARSRGLSLVETVMGLTLLLMVMVVGINLLPVSLRAMSSGEHKVAAANLAQSLLEEKRSGNYDNLASGYLPDVVLNRMTYHVYLDVDSSKPRLKRLSLCVSWDSRGKAQSVTHKVSVCKLPR